MGFVSEFREFALKGNVLDLAVGVIIGAAFGKIVDSLINDVIMPVVGQVVGNVDFKNLFIPLSGQKGIADLDAARKAGAVLAYGNFITIAINFFILAFVIFLVVKAFNTAKKRFEAEKAPAAPAGPSSTDKLLMEIRDSLKR